MDKSKSINWKYYKSEILKIQLFSICRKQILTGIDREVIINRFFILFYYQ